jgi:hypothetical protein
MASLFDLTDDWLHVYNMPDDTDPMVWFDTLEAIQGSIEEKAEGYVEVMAMLDGDDEVFTKEIERLTKRRQVIRNRKGTMKQNLQQTMELTGVDKITTPLHKISIQNNAPSVKITSEMAIPDRYKIEQEPKIDKKALLADLKEGEVIDGAEIQQTRSIRIR